MTERFAGHRHCEGGTHAVQPDVWVWLHGWTGIQLQLEASIDQALDSRCCDEVTTTVMCL
jgi:hypothetical protein